MKRGRIFKGWSITVTAALLAAPLAGIAQEPGSFQVAAAIGEELTLPKTAPKTTTTPPGTTAAKPAEPTGTATAKTAAETETETLGMSTSTMVLIGVGAAALLAAAAGGGGGGGGSSSHPRP
jgi:hypothetical protein